MCSTDQPTLGLEFQERLDSWACCSVAPGELEKAVLASSCLLLINWCKAKGELSSGVVKGFSKKAKLTIKKHYEFRTFGGLEITPHHSMGYLPEPK